MPDAKILEDIRILNTKKANLEKEVKSLENDIRERHKNVGELRYEAGKLSDSLKKLREEHKDLQRIAQEVSSATKREKDDLCRQAEGLVKTSNEVAERILEASKRESELNALSLSIKSQQKDLEAKVLEHTTAVCDLAKARVELNEKAKEAADRLTAIALDEAAFELRKKDLGEAENELRKREAALVDNWKEVNAQKAKNASVQADNAKELDRLKAEWSKVEKAQESVNKLQKEATDKLVSLGAEKDALDKQRQVIERDRLRVEKLAKEKDVEKELEALRRGDK